MSIASFRSSYSQGLFLHVFRAVWAISMTGIFFSARVTHADSATVWGTTRQCEFSIQLQKPPYREDFIARVATAVADYWAANTAPSTAPETWDDSGFSLFSFGRASNAEQGGIDSFSKDCLGCHDGLRASDVSVDYRSRPGMRTGRLVSGKDHPIGMEYASYAAFGRGYKPVTALNTRMVLVNGRVGCLTCHNPLNPEKSHLVMGDFGSALCLTCHDK